MKESYWGYWLIILGTFVIIVMMLIQNVTTTNTQDYYLLKEVTEAAMADAIDEAHYRNSGELKINEQKFVENFMRRFADAVSTNEAYDIKFYAIYEVPPKVSVEVTTKSNSFNVAGDVTAFDVVNRIDAILETRVNPDTGEENYVIDCVRR